MSKKILVSLSIIGAVAAIAIGGTIAYFSDTETSTGNTFTAGKLDLIFKVDGQEVNGKPLFTLTDMKPGDQGEETVSLVVENNPACGKVTIDLKDDLDNTCTEPEGVDENAGDPPCDSDGELNEAVNWMIWKDTDCDNVYDQGEEFLVSGPLTEDKVYSIGELPTSAPVCYGIAYCFGDWKNNYTECDGSLVNNAAQTDSFSADLIIDALQKRNQFPNGCPSVGPWPQQQG